MSENIYRLDLTERERELIGPALVVMAIQYGNAGQNAIAREYDVIRYRVDALEPIGTGGTTEGA